MERRPGGGTDPRGSKGGGKQSSPGARVAAAASGGGGGGGGQRPSDPSWARGAAPTPTPTPAPRGGAPDPGTPRSLGGGGGGPQPEDASARQFLARLKARPLAARAAADVAALVRRAGATLRLRPKEAISMLYSAEIEVTDNRLPNANFVEQRPQHRRSETMGIRTAPPQVTQGKAHPPLKSPQASGQFSVELIRSSAGFGFTLSGGRDAGGDAPLAVRRLLKDGPAQRCGRLQAGDLVLHINGESTQGLTHVEVVDRIRRGGPRLCLVLSRPPETHPGKPEVVGRPQKEDALRVCRPPSAKELHPHCPPYRPILSAVLPSPDRIPDPGEPEMTKTRSASTSSPLQHPRPRTTPQNRGSQEPRLEGAADGPAVLAAERRTEDPNDQTPDSPGPWLTPSEERLSRALGVPGAEQLALEMATGRRRH
ncbi:PDZ domain-containing protein MAGIX isoform X2 [Bos indicus x Bos taurus]|uniref:PDZ domain-containing protein MAGIX isoform X1 n=1 Tax=Bos taurus TaxID=9913 RepID=UPI000383BEE9|nr:PDZ domain-containing protein MAGIX isoform X1 [Bos taurus]XP_027390295.1 PDZ domain-containing protein MAGIX isoform X2 [Bos indicus x Bos taurus]